MSNVVIWVTGLSGAGKTFFATHLREQLASKNIRAIHLDGDDLRSIMGAQSCGDYTRSRRVMMAKTYARLAKHLSEQGFVVIVSTISLFSEIHAWNKQNIRGYYEVLLDTPMTVLKANNQKQLYSKFQNQQQKNVAGLDLKVDFPKNPKFKFTSFGHHEVALTADFIAAQMRGHIYTPSE